MPLYLLLADSAGDAVLLTQDAVEVCYSLRHRRLEADGGAATEGGLIKLSLAKSAGGCLRLHASRQPPGCKAGSPVHRIPGYQVLHDIPPLQQLAELVRLLRPVIDIAQHDVLEKHLHSQRKDVKSETYH
jgi:hypothetical protein